MTVDKVMSSRETPSKPSASGPEKQKKKEINLLRPRRKKTARERIYLGKFEDDLSFLEDFVEFQKLCQHETKSQYTVPSMEDCLLCSILLLSRSR